MTTFFLFQRAAAFLRCAALGALSSAVLCAIATAATVAGHAAQPPDAATMRDAALADDTLAWQIIEGLTTEVGPRLAATDPEARARAWAVAELKSLGFHDVHTEPFDMPLWVRGDGSAEIVSPYPQPLVIAALGTSAATPAGGITAEVTAFDGLAALAAAPDAAVRGKIVFITHHMAAQQDGGAYGDHNAIRFTGPAVAAGKGAVAVVVRSMGTDHHRLAHTGATKWPPGVSPIPAAALSVPDAEQLTRILSRGKPVTLHLLLEAHMAGTAQSGNVVAEVPGRDPKAGIIVIGGHLDSWDEGTGAIDDAAGLGIVTAAAKRLMDGGVPRRTVRLVWFGAEEAGGLGAVAYGKAHAAEKPALVAESDLGADRVWRFVVSAKTTNDPLMERLAHLLEPLGIIRGHEPAHGGTDVAPLAAGGAPVIDLEQDATRYFELHHTADDTLDKIDPAQLRQNVAAWTTLLAVAANEATLFDTALP